MPRLNHDRHCLQLGSTALQYRLLTQSLIVALQSDQLLNRSPSFQERDDLRR